MLIKEEIKIIKIGAITIGQSPRTDVTPDVMNILGKNVELVEIGALDDLTVDDIKAFSPIEGDYVLVSKLKDGTSVTFAEKHIIPKLQECINILEDRGVEIIMFYCTGEFPDILKSKVPLIYPSKILSGIVPSLSKNSSIVVVTPDEKQILQSKKKWDLCIKNVDVVVASPYGGIENILKAAEQVKHTNADLSVMDCIGYNVEMKNLFAKISDKPVILGRTIAARVVKEFIEGIL